MPGYNDIWNSLNTLFETGLEIYRLMAGAKTAQGTANGVAAQQLADGVLLVSNDKDVLLAVSLETARHSLSEAAIKHGKEKDGYLCYPGAASAIPLFELSRTNAAVKEHIVSEESLRATLCGNYPEYVKAHNAAAPAGERIENADAPRYLFLQKQLDNAADSTRAEVADYHATHDRDSVFERSRTDDVLEMER